METTTGLLKINGKINEGSILKAIKAMLEGEFKNLMAVEATIEGRMTLIINNSFQVVWLNSKNEFAINAINKDGENIWDFSTKNKYTFTRGELFSFFEARFK